MKSFQACYLIYKQFEPNSLAIHAVLLLAVPSILFNQLAPQLSILQQISAMLLYWALILAFTALYRLSPLHPLAKYPGATPAKLSKIYSSYLTARGDIYREIKSWHDQYGDVVRIGLLFPLL